VIGGWITYKSNPMRGEGMGKKRPTTRSTWDSRIQARLQQVGPHELVADPGYVEIHFGSLLNSVNGLPDFQVSWFVSGPGRTTPTPEEGLFALWAKYQTAHTDMSEVYRRFLFERFEKSNQAGYDDRQWKLLRRSRPTCENMKSVVSSADLRLEQQQSKKEAFPEFQIQISFNVFWDEHGLAIRLHESSDGFTLGEWTGIGDL
jgi:hypothetical protein